MFHFLFPLYGWADQRRREGNERDRGNAAEESHADDEMVANVAGPAPQNLKNDVFYTENRYKQGETLAIFPRCFRQAIPRL